ncbi:hypothetical protein GGS21DRAFT_491069 [Xylaria nigripes]|nr:hypothetical protein GGS21DRAFT_491069 [Xylaria nigripes]
MESFSLAASHAGAIQHVHVIQLDASAVAAARELRIAVTVIVAGWVAIAGEFQEALKEGDLAVFFGRSTPGYAVYQVGRVLVKGDHSFWVLCRRQIWLGGSGVEGRVMDCVTTAFCARGIMAATQVEGLGRTRDGSLQIINRGDSDAIFAVTAICVSAVGHSTIFAREPLISVSPQLLSFFGVWNVYVFEVSPSNEAG